MSAARKLSAAEIAPGDLELYDNALPPLVAGDYVVSLSQDAGGDGFSETFERTQRMRVAGPHFGLLPDDVFSVYPPSGSTADYSESLPHVVLTRRNLPWEIAVGGATSGPVVAPWLALLLLTPEEVIAGDAPSGSAGGHTVPVSTFLAPPKGIAGPAFDQEQVQELEDEAGDASCVVVDVVPGAFAAVAPRVEELPFLAHVRQIDPANQEDAALDGDGWYSVVLGNRLCSGSTSGVYLAHLVSLEGMTGYLPPAAPPAGTEAIRLVSLASWTFNGLAAAGDFAGLMSDLDDAPLTMPPPKDPSSPPEVLVADALANGYTAADYRTRLGERTVGWYRGPCLPVQMMHDPQPAYPSAEAGMIYDATTGMFDVSFAVAWQTGRSLTLANRAVAISLLQWLRAHEHRAHLLVERLAHVASGVLGESLTDAGDLTRRGVVDEAVLTYLTNTLGPLLAPADPRANGRFGARVDATGLAHAAARLPGLLTTDEVKGLLATGRDVSTDAVDAARERARRDPT